MATEVMGIIYGPYGGSSRDLQAGGLSYQSSYMPHGGASRRLLAGIRGRIIKTDF